MGLGFRDRVSGLGGAALSDSVRVSSLMCVAVGGLSYIGCNLCVWLAPCFMRGDDKHPDK